MQIADIRYTSKADFAGSALHILHRGTNSIVYLATAQETGLKLLLKAYDIGGHLEDLFWFVMVHFCIMGGRQLLFVVCGRIFLQRSTARFWHHRQIDSVRAGSCQNCR